MCEYVKKDRGAGPIIRHWTSDTYRFLIGKSVRKSCFEENIGKSEFWKNYAHSKTFEDVVLFLLGDDRLRKLASSTLMNSRERRGKLKVSKLRHYRV